MGKSNDFGAFFIALAITAAMGAGLVYFVRVLWPLLPAWLSMIIFIIIAVAVIGYPIYALARWSDRYLARQRKNIEAPDDPANKRDK